MSNSAGPAAPDPVQGVVVTPRREVAGRKRVAKTLRLQSQRLAHLRFVENLDRVNSAIHGTNDLERMMTDALVSVLSIFECDRAWLVFPCDPEAAVWGCPMERTRPEYPGEFALGIEQPVDEHVAKS